MSSTTETDLMIEIHKALLTLKEIKQVLVYQFTPVDRGAFISPTTCIYFEEETVENRNRVDAITGILHIETIWILDSGRKDVEFWRNLTALKARIQSALYSRAELLAMVGKFSRMPAQILSVNDDELHLTQQYRITFFTAMNDLSTQTI